MARINVYETDESGERTLAGWFDPAKCESFTEGSRWNGNNIIGVISGAQIDWVDETLYRATLVRSRRRPRSGGRRWGTRRW